MEIQEAVAGILDRSRSRADDLISSGSACHIGLNLIAGISFGDGSRIGGTFLPKTLK